MTQTVNHVLDDVGLSPLHWAALDVISRSAPVSLRDIERALMQGGWDVAAVLHELVRDGWARRSLAGYSLTRGGRTGHADVKRRMELGDIS